MIENTVSYKFHTCGFKKCAPCYVKEYEGREIDYVCQYLDKLGEVGQLKGVFVDVGAHVGLWSMVLSEWYQNCTNVVPSIYAVEADELNYRQLVKNAAQPQTGITAINLAAWNKNETLVLKRNANPGRHKVVTAQFTQPNEPRVQAIVLDSIATSKEQRQIDVIKIDVEGAELNVLNGARQIMNDNEQLLIVVEYSIGHFSEYGYRITQLTAFMKEHGFRLARPVDEKTAVNIRLGEVKRVMFIKGDIG